MRVDRRLLGWGIFFILVGTIPIATRAGYLDRGLIDNWFSLWPLLLIGWGLSLVLRGTPIDWLGGAVAAITFGIMGGGLLATGFAGGPITAGCGGQAPGTAFQTQTGPIAGVQRLNVELNCGTLTMQPVDGSTWSVAGTESEGRTPRIRTEGSAVTIDAGDRTSFFDTGRTDWTVSVPRSPQLGIGMTINAGSGTVDLDGATLAAVNATVNAGSARIDLGGTAQLGDINATVNAGSAVIVLPSGGRSGSLSLNAGSLDVCVAAGTPVRVDWSGALGSNDLDEAGLTKVDDDTWESPGLSALTPFLDLNVSANAGSFGFDTDGTCDA
jgi:hypothetical protein